PVPRDDGAGAAPAATGWRDSLTEPRVLPEDTLRHRECRQAAAWLAAQMRARGLAPRQVMVLARRRVALAAMDEALRALHIPATQPEKTDLRDAPEVQDVIALLDALVSPAHDLSLVQALKSPVFGFDDDDLVALAVDRRRRREAGADDGWWALLQAPGAGLPAALAERVATAGTTLGRWRGWIDRLPPHDAIDAIYHDGDLLARFAAAAPAALRSTVLARLRAVPGAALQIDAGRFSTPYGFVRRLKAGGVKAPLRAEADAVRLLTVHGAKGLEADLVLLLDTDAAPARGETMGVLVDWPGEAPVPRTLLFFTSESRPPPGAAAAMAVEQVERRREELNGLYVATTRARRELVLSCVEPHRAHAGSWWRRMEALAEPVPADALADAAVSGGPGMAANGAEPEAAVFSMPFLPPAQAVPAQDAIEIEAESLASEADTPASAIGQAMHRLLEWATAGGTGFTDAQRDAAARAYGLDAAQAGRAAALAQAVRDGEGRWIWDAALLDWQGNEVPVSHAGQPLRIDRLVRRRDTGAWWVIDYKSAAAPERQPLLVAQLQQYRAAVQAAYPEATVMAAFLTGRGGLVVLPAEAGSAGVRTTTVSSAPVSAVSPPPDAAAPPSPAAGPVGGPPVQADLFS
ncbi:3'-5' exonuclease, partial [uncultured Xylophilus sp.]|uniref:3'-5' exonuclease n=1 Tax=uncultured Xylophilus sp. TaxID=296832 RepID=UPI0025D63FE8